jgi:ribokinase
MTTAPRIVVVGSTMVDLIAYADPLPGPGETVEGRDFRLGFGGKGANQAVMAARLGADVTFVNRVGDDLFGRRTSQNLSERGIDTRHVSIVEGAATGVAPIWVEADGTNRIIVVAGANEALTADAVRADLAGIDGADCVVCQLEIPLDGVAEALRAGREWGAITILNPAPIRPLAADLLALVDWLVPNEIEFALLAGGPPDDEHLLAQASALGCGLVVTLGARGAAAALDGRVERFGVPSVEVTDTTGAGDAFVGGFAWALARGDDVAEAVLVGNACGALSVTRAGTQASFPALDAVLAALATEEVKGDLPC